MSWRGEAWLCGRTGGVWHLIIVRSGEGRTPTAWQNVIFGVTGSLWRRDTNNAVLGVNV